MQIITSEGRIDVLVNNVGDGTPGDMLQFDQGWMGQTPGEYYTSHMEGLHPVQERGQTSGWKSVAMTSGGSSSV